MGLDSFWRGEDPENEFEITFDPPLRLCGGMISSNGEGSFRGKVYADAIEQITGVSLYQQRIDAETVRQMNEKLQAAPTPIADFEEAEWADVKRMFAEYSKHNAYLYGWW